MGDARTGQLVDQLPLAVQYALIRELLVGDQFEVTPAAPIWTVTNANGGTATAANSELTMSTSANANGSTAVESIAPLFTPGAFHLFHAGVKVGDTGLANNARRFGAFTSGPGAGYFFELLGTTFSSCFARLGGITRTNASAWLVPFTIDANYHLYEILYNESFALFAVDGQVREILPVAGTVSRIGASTVPVRLENINTASAATNEQMFLTEASVSRLGASDPLVSSPIPTTVAASASNVNLLLANVNRKGASIYNDSASQVYVKLGATASTTSFTVLLPPGGLYEVPFGYVGNIDAIWTTATGNARITELFA